MTPNRRLPRRLTRALMGLLVLAVLLPVGMRPSEAAFVAATANPGSQFTAAADFNTVAVALTDPGSPAARVGSGHRHGGVGPRHHLRRVLDRARRHRHLDRGLHEDGRALHLHLRHDDGRRRAARRARRGDRQRRLHAHLDGHQPPRRQHRADRGDDRSRLAADRHRHRRRHRGRRRLRPRQRRASSTSRRPARGRASAPRRPRRSPAPGTPRRSPTGSTTCARSPPTSPATRRSPPRSTTAASTTRRRPSR